jgi:hypothetical protein
MTNDAQEIEPIIERPVGELYGTESYKRRRRNKRDYDNFYDNQMNFVQDKYRCIAQQLVQKEAVEVK